MDSDYNVSKEAKTTSLTPKARRIFPNWLSKIDWSISISIPISTSFDGRCWIVNGPMEINALGMLTSFPYVFKFRGSGRRESMTTTSPPGNIHACGGIWEPDCVRVSNLSKHETTPPDRPPWSWNISAAGNNTKACSDEACKASRIGLFRWWPFVLDTSYDVDLQKAYVHSGSYSQQFHPMLTLQG